MAMEKNIVYFDTVTGRDKTARHCRIDEFHYGTPSEARPSGAQQLLEAVFPNTIPGDASEKDRIEEFFEESPDIQPVPLDEIALSQEDTPVTAAAATLLGETQTQEILHLDTDSLMYGPPTTLRIPLNRLPTLGLLLREDSDTGQVFVRACQEGTYCYRISRRHSTIRNSVLRSIDDHQMRTEAQVKAYVTIARARRETHVQITFAKIEVRIEADEEIPQLHFDQPQHLNQLHILIRQSTDETRDAFLSYTRSRLKRQPGYQEWRDSEWRQHDKYKVQDMFGEPVPCPSGANVLPIVWDYMTKEDSLTGALIKKL